VQFGDSVIDETIYFVVHLKTRIKDHWWSAVKQAER